MHALYIKERELHLLIALVHMNMTQRRTQRIGVFAYVHLVVRTLLLSLSLSLSVFVSLAFSLSLATIDHSYIWELKINQS